MKWDTLKQWCKKSARQHRFYIIMVCLYVFYGTVITLAWQQYELNTIGKVMANTFDSWIAIILSWSLSINTYILIENIRRKRERQRWNKELSISILFGKKNQE